MELELACSASAQVSFLHLVFASQSRLHSVEVRADGCLMRHMCRRLLHVLSHSNQVKSFTKAKSTGIPRFISATDEVFVSFRDWLNVLGSGPSKPCGRAPLLHAEFTLQFVENKKAGCILINCLLKSEFKQLFLMGYNGFGCLDIEI
jgi:hypothetical protein